jgi:segregation and condensation protein B
LSDEHVAAIPKDLIAKVEAALYASGRPIDPAELAKVAGTASERKAVAIVREIAKAVNSSLNAVEIVEYPGPRFAMQLKAEYTPVARKFATRPLLTRASLKTLSYIAYFQPIASSDLVLRRSSTVYQHLRELEEVGFIVGERQGRSKVYRTTGRFAEYFGLSIEPTSLKRQLESRNLTLR